MGAAVAAGNIEAAEEGGDDIEMTDVNLSDDEERKF